MQMVFGPTMVLATVGTVAVATPAGERRELAVGTAAFVTADEAAITLSGSGEVFVASPGR